MLAVRSARLRATIPSAIPRFRRSAASSTYTSTLLSRKSSLIHLVPRELAPLCAVVLLQFMNEVEPILSSLFRLRVIAEPAPEFIVDRRMVSSRPLARRLNEALVGTQSDVLHLTLRGHSTRDSCAQSSCNSPSKGPPMEPAHPAHRRH